MSDHIKSDSPDGAVVLRRFVQRFFAWRIRREKNKQGLGWLRRWERACRKCWAILGGGDASVERFARFARNHDRLIRLITAKQPGKGGKIKLND